MKRGIGIAVGGLALAAVCAVAWWSFDRGSSTEYPKSADPGDIAPESAATPPPPLASPGLDRHARAATSPPVESRAGPVSGPGDRHLRGQVLDAEGKPVVGALVREVGAPDPAPTATTDAEGRFDLTSTANPPSILLVSAPGFVQVSVSAGALAAGLPIALAKEWTISGTVRDADTGETVGGVPVSARPTTSPEGGYAGRATSGADGAFRVTVPGAGVYVLDVGARYLGGVAGTGDEWVPTLLQGVAAGTSDLRVTLVRGRSIEGEIVDDSGERVTRRVVVDAVRLTPTGDHDYTTRKIVYADAGGLRVPGLPPGRYDLSVNPVADPTDAGAASFSATVVKEIEAGTHGLVVRLFRGFLLTGRLDDGAGEAVTGAGYIYVYREGEMGRGHAVYAEIPGDGTFRAGPLDVSYRYDLLATGFAARRPTTLKGISPRDTNVVVVLERAGQIAGRVETEDGKPVPAGVPIGFVGEGMDPTASGSRVFGFTTADGTFVVDGLVDGRFTVEAGGGMSGYLGTVVKGVETGAKDLVLRVSVGVDLSGTLVDEKGEPLATTSLAADDGARMAAMRPYAQVGANGKFILRGLRAGPVTLSLRIGGAFVRAGTYDAPATGLKVVVPAR